MRFVGRVVWFVKYEATNGVETGSGEVSLDTVYAEPGSDGDEVIIRRRELSPASDVVGYEVVLLSVARSKSADIGDVEETLYDTVKRLCTVGGQGCQVLLEVQFVCQVSLVTI